MRLKKMFALPKVRAILILMSILSMLLTALRVHAISSISFDFTAHVTVVEDPNYLLGGTINVGDTVAGWFTYDLDTLDSDPWPDSAIYAHYEAPYGISATVNGLTFGTDPASTWFSVYVRNDYPIDPMDSIMLVGYENLFPIPIPMEEREIAITLADSSGTALSNTNLPTSFDVSLWEQANLFLAAWGGGLGESYLVKAVLDTVVVANRLPIARAGNDQHVSFDDLVVLDGSLSSDLEDPLDQLTFHWELIGVSSVVLTGADTVTATFTAPHSVESLTFRLTVTDTAGNSWFDEVTVTVFEDLSHAIFVSSSLGDDSNPGTKDAPVQTLGKAFELAGQTDPHSDMYVHEGDYSSSSTLTILDDMSLYGGFEAFHNPPDDPALTWTRTASNPTRIIGATTAIKVMNIASPTTIDGLTIESADASTDDSTLNVDGNGFFLRAATQRDINQVWLVYYEPVPGQDVGIKISTLVTSDLTTAVPCGTVGHHYTDEIQVDVPILKDPNTDPSPYYLFEFIQEFIDTGETHLYWDFDQWEEGGDDYAVSAEHATPIPGNAFVRGWDLVPGYTLLRETVYFHDARDCYPLLHTEYEQVLRGPDGDLYLYRNPGYLYPYYMVFPPAFEGDLPPSENDPGENWLQHLDPSTGSTYFGLHPYDITVYGGLGGDSIGIHVINADAVGFLPQYNLRITNNKITAGWGAAGGAGENGPDGGKGGSGNDGGNSIGIYLENSLYPSIMGNTISTKGGGNGGDGGEGGAGGDGGNSCGIRLSEDSVIMRGTVERGNMFYLGNAGFGGIPDGKMGARLLICPPPGPIQIIELDIPILSQETVTVFGSVPQYSQQATFSSSWGGSDVVMTLVTPSGRTISRDTVDPDVTHLAGADFEVYSITDPEAGDWTIQLFGADVPPTGEEVAVSLAMTPDSTSPTTTLTIGSPQYVDVTGQVFVDSNTLFTLTALDDNGLGSGVVATAYRIRNSTYNTGWMAYDVPFNLAGLEDDTYHIEYNSTDNSGNVEATNAATVILDNTPSSTSLTIGEPKYVASTEIYTTQNTPFTLEASDLSGSGVQSFGYKVYNTTYDSGWVAHLGSFSGWKIKTEPFYLDWLGDGVYTIAYTSTDNIGNVEATNTATIILDNYLVSALYEISSLRECVISLYENGEISKYNHDHIIGYLTQTENDIKNAIGYLDTVRHGFDDKVEGLYALEAAVCRLEYLMNDLRNWVKWGYIPSDLAEEIIEQLEAINRAMANKAKSEAESEKILAVTAIENAEARGRYAPRLWNEICCIDHKLAQANYWLVEGKLSRAIYYFKEALWKGQSTTINAWHWSWDISLKDWIDQLEQNP